MGEKEEGLKKNKTKDKKLPIFLRGYQNVRGDVGEGLGATTYKVVIVRTTKSKTPLRVSG